MSLIKAIQAREILDGRGIPAIEIALWFDNNGAVVTSVTTDSHNSNNSKMVHLKDNDYNRMQGQGVLKAINNINNIIAPKIVNNDPNQQEQLDSIMINLDGTENLEKFGANSILAVSQAITKAAAMSNNMSLYYYLQQKYQLTSQLFVPPAIYGIINGANYGSNNLDLQEFQVIPASYLTFQQSLEIISTIWQKLGELLINKGAIHSTGIVGGYAPNLYSNTDAFELLIETIKATRHNLTQEVFLGIDAAAYTFYDNGRYKIRDVEKAMSSKDLIKYYQRLKEEYQLIYIEDPFDEDDTKAWTELTNILGKTTRIAADNLIISDQKLIKQANKNNLCNTVVIKPNHLGTITNTINSIKDVQNAGWQVIISHRSGETNDDFIADLAVGVGADYAKFGPVNRGERISKYNRLLQIFYELHPEINQTQQNQQPPKKEFQTQSMNTPKSNIKFEKPKKIKVGSSSTTPTLPETQSITGVEETKQLNNQSPISNNQQAIQVDKPINSTTTNDQKPVVNNQQPPQNQQQNNNKLEDELNQTINETLDQINNK